MDKMKAVVIDKRKESGKIQRCIELVEQTSSFVLELELPAVVPTVCRTFVLEMEECGVADVWGESWSWMQGE